MVDVTHHGHDRRTGRRESSSSPSSEPNSQVEGLEQLAVLVLGRDDLDDVVELLTEQLQRRVVDRLGRGDHLTEVEQHLHQRGRVDADLLGEVGQRGAARQANGLAVALADADAADRRRLHLLELLTTRALRLATTTRRATGTTERTLGAAATTGTTTTRTTGTTATGGRATEATTGGTTEAATAGSATTSRGTAAGHHGRHRDHQGHHGHRRDHRGHRGRRPPGPPPKAAGDLGIIAGLGRGMPSPRPAGGRGGRWSPVPVPAPGVGAERLPMPWVDENGLLPGRGAPGRAGRGPGLKRAPVARAASPSEPSSVAARVRPAPPRSRPGPRARQAPRARRASSGSAALVRGPGRGAALAAGASAVSSAATSAGAASSLGSGAGAAFFAGAFLAAFLAALASALAEQVGAVLVFEPLHDGRFHRRAGCLHELTELVQHGQDVLRRDVVLLGEFMDSDLGHVFPPGPNPSWDGESGPLVDVHAHRAVLRGSHRRLMSSCSRSSWVLPHLGVCIGLREVLSQSLEAQRSPGPRHHAVAPGRRHVCVRRVRDIRAWGADAPRDPVRCRSGRVRRTRNWPGPPRPSLRPPATTHAWRLVPGIRCRSGLVRRCGSGCRVVKPPPDHSTGAAARIRTGKRRSGATSVVDVTDRATRVEAEHVRRLAVHRPGGAALPRSTSPTSHELLTSRGR